VQMRSPGLVVLVSCIALALCSPYEAFAGDAAASTADGGRTVRVDRKPEHPFVFVGRDEIADLRERTRSSHRRQFENLKAWAAAFEHYEPLAPEVLPTDRDDLQVYYENAAPYVLNMALLYQLTDDEAYAQAAHKWLMALCTYPSETNGGYFIGAYAVGLAAGYDLLYDYLSQADRDTVRDHLAAVVERGYRGVLSDWWAGISLHHDHWLPITGLGVGAVAIAGEVPESTVWLERFLNTFLEDVKLVGEDGSWTEGTANCAYAMVMTYAFCDAYRNLTGENLFELPFLRGGAAYRLYSWLPDDTYVNHHDSFHNGRYNVMGCATGHLMRRLAGEYSDAHAQWLAEREEAFDLRGLEGLNPNEQWALSKRYMVPSLHSVGWGLMWYDADVAPLPPDDLPTYRFFPNQGLVNLRSGWRLQDVAFSFTCAPVGGHRGHDAVLAGNRRLTSNIAHIHAQANSFDLFAYGNYLAVPPGYGDSDSQFHNTLVIEGTNQRRSPLPFAEIVRHDVQEDFACFVGDATDCYPDEIGLERWRRHVACLRPNAFVICDELAVAQPRPSEKPTTWHLNYNPFVNAVDVDAAGRAFTVRPNADNAGKGALIVRFLQPEEMEIETAVLRRGERGYIRFGQVSASVHDLFSAESRAQILAVLIAQQDPAAPPPELRGVRRPGIVGAVVDEAAASRCVLFNLEGPADGEIALRLRGRAELSCHLVGLAPNSSYDVTSRSEPCGEGLFEHSVSVRKGTRIRANEAGDLRFVLRAPQ